MHNNEYINQNYGYINAVKNRGLWHRIKRSIKHPKFIKHIEDKLTNKTKNK